MFQYRLGVDSVKENADRVSHAKRENK